MPRQHMAMKHGLSYENLNVTMEFANNSVLQGTTTTSTRPKHNDTEAMQMDMSGRRRKMFLGRLEGFLGRLDGGG